MEDAGRLQADDELHRLALQTVFLPVINEYLTNFAAAWNMHRIRTAHNQTPNQLWVEGMLHVADSAPQTVAAELNNCSENLLERLTSRLAEIGVDTSTVDSEAHTAPVRGSLVLTREQQHELKVTLESISASFMQSPEDASLPPFLPVTFVVPVKRLCHYWTL